MTEKERRREERERLENLGCALAGPTFNLPCSSGLCRAMCVCSAVRFDSLPLCSLLHWCGFFFFFTTEPPLKPGLLGQGQERKHHILEKPNHPSFCFKC